MVGKDGEQEDLGDRAGELLVELRLEDSARLAVLENTYAIVSQAEGVQEGPRVNEPWHWAAWSHSSWCPAALGKDWLCAPRAQPGIVAFATTLQ